jgi:excinuclease ABC subunit A
VGEKPITELVLMPVEELYDFFEHLLLDEHDMAIANRLLTEIQIVSASD